MQSNLITKTFVSLDHNYKLTKARRFYQRDKITQMDSSKLALCFRAFHYTIKKRKANLSLGEVFSNIITTRRKTSIFRDWHSTAFDYKRASMFRKRKLWAFTRSKFSTGIVVQRYLGVCESKAMKWRAKRLKKAFL